MAETAKEHLDRLEDAVYQLRDADLAPAVESLAALRKQIAELTAEREVFRSWRRVMINLLEKRWVNIIALKEALRPFAQYIEARLAVFSRESRNAYPELLVSGKSGEPTTDIRAEDWERARAAFRGFIS